MEQFIVQRLDRIEGKVDGLDARLQRLEIDADRLRDVNTKIGNLDGRVTKLETDAITRTSIASSWKWVAGIVFASAGTIVSLAFTIYHAIVGPVVK